MPWSWFESCKAQRENNSIVIFSPNNGTMHAVKASYDHLSGQRTQMYANHWYLEKQTDCGPEWEDFVVKAHVPNVSWKSKITAYVPSSVKDLIKGEKVQDAHVVAGDF